QMNEPPGARARVGLTGLTLAEYFRDEFGQDVLLFIDNVFRYMLAGSEVSALLGRIPSAVGYQPTLATEMGDLEERITSTKKGSITSVQAVFVPADDYTDPAITTTFAHLGATVSLSRAIVEAVEAAKGEGGGREEAKQKAEQPKDGQPKGEQPKAEPSKGEQPKADQSKGEQPKAEQSKTPPPKAEQPKKPQPKAAAKDGQQSR